MASLTTTSDNEIGRREVDEKNINSGILRCPCCSSRMLMNAGTLVERYGEDQILWIPRPNKKKNQDEEETFTWEQDRHQWWWSVPDIDDFSNVGLSRMVDSPAGPVKIVLCSECQSGPFGYTTFDKDSNPTNPVVWLCSALLKQVDASLADDEEDFKAPQGIDIEALRGMIESGALATQFQVTFEEQRLGMMLSDAEDGDGVIVVAFTESNGELGPAEIGGDIKIGDKVIKVNGTSTSGLCYADVLTMVIEAPRPITLHFERKGNLKKDQQKGTTVTTRVAHQQWNANFTNLNSTNGETKQ
jgi:hypothetical protein